MAQTEKHASIEEINVRMAENGRVVIPARLRRALGVRVGDALLVRLQEGELRMTTQRRRIQQAQERAAKYLDQSISLVEELSSERREAAGRE